MKKDRKNRIIFILSVLLIVSIGFPIVKEHFFPENKAEVSSQAVKLRLEVSEIIWVFPDSVYANQICI